MRSVIFVLTAFVAAFSWTVGGPARAEDRIVIESMRVEGVIPKADDPIFDINPYRKDRVAYASIQGPLGGGGGRDGLTVVVTRDKTRAAIGMSFGGDKKLKEQAEKLAGQRVVVECKGEYTLGTWKKLVPQRQGSAEEEQPYATLVLTVVKIEPAK
jgi:hypothetical protein